MSRVFERRRFEQGGVLGKGCGPGRGHDFYVLSILYGVSRLGV